MTARERPGVYAEYIVNGSADTVKSGLTVGIAAAVNGSSTDVADVSSYLSAVESYGVCAMTRLIKTVYFNGGTKIIAAPVSGSNYADAFSDLIDEGADIIICDSNLGSVALSLKNAVDDTEFCLGIAECSGTASQCVSLAGSFNFERMILCGGSDGSAGNIAAALAGVLASEDELYLNGHALQNVSALARTWTEQEIESLISGGVTPIEADGSSIVTVRGITSKTTTDGVSDKSLREIAVMMTAREVLKSVYDALKLKFVRARNDALTRGAIRSQVAVELEKKLNEGKISAYGSISAAADTSDASLCRVGFEFTAVCGLSTIMLTAYLNV